MAQGLSGEAVKGNPTTTVIPRVDESKPSSRTKRRQNHRTRYSHAVNWYSFPGDPSPFQTQNGKNKHENLVVRKKSRNSPGAVDPCVAERGFLVGPCRPGFSGRSRRLSLAVA